MSGTMRSTLLATAVAALLASTVQMARAQGADGKKAVDAFKNIQVLKDMPAEQLGPTMQFFAASLGVECEFCHDRERDKDVKEQKQTARKMIKMVMAVNKDTFEGEQDVTCYSCHRGNERPIGTPLVAGQEPPKPGVNEERPPKEQNLPSVDQLFDKFVAAIGGQGALQKASSRVIKGSMMTDSRGQQIPIEILDKSPGARFSVVHATQGDNITAVNGGMGWTRGGNGPTRDLAAAALDSAKLEDQFFFAGKLKQVLNDAKVDDRMQKIGRYETYVVTAKTQALPRVRLYFDKDSGLLVRLVNYTQAAVGRLPVQIDYDDYRDLDGIKVPYQWTIAQPRGRATYHVDQIQQNVPIDDAKFSKPAAAPAPAAASKRD
jgi:photosynthetic reaction center cytochrome c subunit